MKKTSHTRAEKAVIAVPNASCRNTKQFWAGCALAIVTLFSGASCSAAGASFVSYQLAMTPQAQGSATIRHGILTLAVPTLVLFALIVAMVYKRRNVSR